MPCHLEKSCVCNRAQQIGCKNWEPSRKNVYYTCDYYFQYKLECPFKENGKVYPCAKCKYYDYSNDKGRPNRTGVDWSDKSQVAQYKKEHR